MLNLSKFNKEYPKEIIYAFIDNFYSFYIFDIDTDEYVVRKASKFMSREEMNSFSSWIELGNYYIDNFVDESCREEFKKILAKENIIETFKEKSTFKYIYKAKENGFHYFEGTFIRCYYQDKRFCCLGFSPLDQKIQEDIDRENRMNRTNSINNVFKEVFQLQNSGVISYYLKTRKVIFVNNAFKELYDIEDDSMESIKEAYTRIKIENEELIKDKLYSFSKEGDQLSYNLIITHKNGYHYRVWARSKVVKILNGELVVISTLENISEFSELQLAYEEINKKQEMLEKLLFETNEQRILLEKTFDDFKKADYQRRRDYLTNLFNRQELYHMCDKIKVGKAKCFKAMLMIDIDDFKKFNDTYGHVKGDEALNAIGSALKEYGKKYNIYFYRYGGEEIIGLCYESIYPLKELVEGIRKLILSLNILRDDITSKQMTCSIGYTSTFTEDVTSMMLYADKAMYKAKSTGKNKVIAYEEL